MECKSREPAKAVSAVFKVPVETWRTIFHFVLGPSCSDLGEENLFAYHRLFTDLRSVKGAYSYRERLKGRIGLVCRSWRDIVADMGDGLVICGPAQDLTWPPGHERKQAKRAIHLNARRWRFDVEWQSEPLTNTVETCEPFATIVTILEVRVESKVGDLRKFTGPAPVKALHWKLEEHGTLDGLWSPVFENLVVLKLVAQTPFRTLDDHSPFSFPSLRTLLLETTEAYGGGKYRAFFRRWSVPRLAICFINVQHDYRQTELRDDVAAFVRTHAQTIEELAFDPSTFGLAQHCLDSTPFPRLMSCHLDDLDGILPVLANLRQRWASGNLDPATRFRFHIGYIDVERRTEAQIAAELEQYAEIFPHIHVRCEWTWREGIRAREDHEIYEQYCFLRAVEEGGGIVEDLEGNTTSSLRSIFPLWSRKHNQIL